MSNPQNNPFLTILLPVLFFSVLAYPQGGNSQNKASTQEINLAAEEETKKQIRELKLRVNALVNDMEMYRSLISGLSSNAVQAPFGRFILIRNKKDECLGIRILEHTRLQNIKVDGQTVRQYLGAKFEWFLQTDGSFDFTRKNVKAGSQELVEDLISAHGSYGLIEVGNFKLKWSLSDWIYFPDEDQEEIKMVRTEWVRIKDVDFKDSSLKWLSRDDLQKPIRR